MRILMTLTYYHPHWTGLTAYAQRLAEGLVRRGHRVTVVSSQFRADLPRTDEHNGVRIVRVPSWMRLSRGQVMPAFRGTVRALLSDHDVVQCHTPMLETWLVGGLAHRARRRMLMTHHGDLVMPAGGWNRFVGLTVGGLLERGARAADAITTHSQDYIDHSAFLRPYADKTLAIFPPVVLPAPDRAAAASWRRALVGASGPLVGFAGRFVEEKGFDVLLKAIPLVARRVPDVRFAYAGDHAVAYERFYQRCRPLVEASRGQLVMAGLLTDPQRLADFYAMCDAFALPSRTDCFPSVQVEAMLCGSPVVASDIPGARVPVGLTGMGLLVPPEDPVALADGVCAVLAERERFRRSREEIERRFSLARCLDDYEALLGRLAEGAWS